jgi:hypothetical protein
LRDPWWFSPLVNEQRSSARIAPRSVRWRTGGLERVEPIALMRALCVLAYIRRSGF